MTGYTKNDQTVHISLFYEVVLRKKCKIVEMSASFKAIIDNQFNYRQCRLALTTNSGFLPEKIQGVRERQYTIVLKH